MKKHRSHNWAGYAITARRPINRVRGSWVEPTVVCGKARASSAFWVGLGGFKKGLEAPLEQTGTEIGCIDGRPKTTAFQWIYPAEGGSMGITVEPGNRLTAEVMARHRVVVMKLDDLTTGVSKTKTFPVLYPNTNSAEWIAESPATYCRLYFYCQQILRLADFGEVTFTEAEASVPGRQPGPIAAPGFTPTDIFLHDRPGVRIKHPEHPVVLGSLGEASPGPLSSNDSSFTVTWERG